MDARIFGDGPMGLRGGMLEPPLQRLDCDARRSLLS